MPAQEMHRYIPAEPPIYHEPAPATRRPGARVDASATDWLAAPAPETTFTDDLNATMKDLGDALRYVGQSVADVVEIVTSAPIMAADGLDKGVKGLPLPGHEGHAAASGDGADGQPVPPPSYREWSRSAAAPAPAARGGTGKPRLAEMATAGARPPSGSSGRTPSGRTPSGRSPSGRTPSGKTPLVAEPPLYARTTPSWGTPAAAASPAVVAPTEAPSPIPVYPNSAGGPAARQPSQKLASGTLGLPRAGFSASLASRRSPSPSSDTAGPGTKPRLSGYYGADKAGGMSVA